MPIFKKLGAKEVAPAACFAAMYVVLSFVPMFHLLGAFQNIAVAATMAHLIGIMLGTYLGALSTFLGGIISFSLNPYVFPQ